MPKNVATARARGLGAELRDIRLKLKLTTREAADRAGWSAAALNRTENGVRATSSEDVATLLATYGVTGHERRRLLGLARDTSNEGWAEAGASDSSAPLKALIAYESQAARIISSVADQPLHRLPPQERPGSPCSCPAVQHDHK